MKDMTKDDLKFVPFEDLIDEIESRTEDFVMAYHTVQEADAVNNGKDGERLLLTRWSKVKNFAAMLGLCECVKRDIQIEAEEKE